MAVYEFLTQNGTIIVDTAQIKDDVEQEWLLLPGIDALPDPSSFEGRLLDAEITSRISVARNNAKLANQQNPNLSSGTFLDAHLALIGTRRDGKTKSTVQCTLTGVAGTFIPALSVVQDVVTKNTWQLVDDVTIPYSNTIDASFESVDYGAISASAGDISKIVTGVLGWETVTNAQSATLGKLQEPDPIAKRKRRVELGKNSRTNAYSILAAVSSVEGVEGVKFRENVTNVTQVIDGISLLPHSTWIVVDGGADLDIAESYYQARNGGTNFNGSVLAPITDKHSGQTIPVSFDRPTEVPLICRVTARKSMTTASTDQIEQAAVDYANGLFSDEIGFAVGEHASPFEIGAAINANLSEIFITRVDLAKKTDGASAFSTDTINLNIFEKPTLEKDDVNVVFV